MDSDNLKDSKLRKKAEEIIQTYPDSINDRIEEEYELNVHKIELEIQNEELRKALLKLEDSQKKYFDLYNFAPVGYFTLNKDGLILDVNLAGSELLGVERLNLHKTAFIQYIDHECRNEYYHNIKDAVETGTKQTTEIKLLKSDNTRFYAHLETINVKYENGDLKEFRIVVTNIDDLKNTEKALKESENYREIFFNDHTVMMLIDPINGDIIDANIAASKFYGYNREELVKMRISDINVSDADIVFEEMQKALSKQKNYFIFKHRLADGKVRDVDVCSGVINQNGKDLLYSIVNDITAQKKAENALRESEELFRLIFDQSPIGSIITTLDYTPLLVNNALTNILGYSKEELLSMKFPEYTYPEDLKLDIEQRKILDSGEVDNFVFEKRYIHKNGEIIWGKLHLSSVKDQSGETIRFLAMVEDITKTKSDEEKLKETMEELKHSNQELEHFAYVASHDLREPLRMITSFLQLLERRYSDQLDQDANEFIGFAVDGAKRLNEMINDLLVYSKVNSKKKDFSLVNCEQVLKMTFINLKVPIEENNAIISHDPLPTIYGDENSMIQLFQNLIGNAIKYRGQEIPKIHISSKKELNQYLFSVKDNGIGIDPEHLNRIFTIFQRLHRNEEYEGTGIGLAIAHKIVHQHGGEIWAESEQGKGSTFYFTIPFKS
jgi:PAS domain S-box-containing protein